MKYSILPLLLIFVTKLCFAQTPQWAWGSSPSIGAGSGSLITPYAATDALGNVYVTGSFSYPSVTFGSTTLTNAGSNTFDIFLVKYSPTGTIVWAVSAGGTQPDIVNGIALASNGDIYLTGHFRSAPLVFGSSTISNVGASTTDDIFLLKFSSSGAALSASSAGGSGDDRSNAISVDGNGNVFIAGYFSSTSISIGSTTLTNAGVTDIFLARYNNSGVATWATSAGAALGEAVTCMTTDAAGDIYVGGYFYSSSLNFGASVLTNAGTTSTRDIFVTKYSSSGTPIWAASGAGSISEDAFSIAVDGLSNVYLGGQFSSPTMSFGSISLANAGSLTGFVVKYTLSGTPAWAVTASAGTGFGIIRGVALDPSGNVVATGSYRGASMTSGSATLTSTSSNNYEAFAVKYTSAGSALWAVQATGVENEYGTGVSSDATGNTFVCGTSNSSIISLGTTSLTGAPSTTTPTVFLAKLGSACTTAPAQPLAISGAANACSGSSQIYSVAAVTGASSYTWTLPTGWTGTSTTNSITATAGTTGGSVTVTATNACGTSTAQTFAVTVSPGPSAAITAAGPVSFCQGGSVVLNATTGPGLTYQWKLNGSNLTGAISASYTANAAGAYSVVVSNSSCSSSSPATTVTVNPLPTVTITQAGNVLTAPAGFSSYKWYKNGTLITGATAPTYTATQSGSYYVIVTNANNCAGQSNTVGLTVGVEDISSEISVQLYPNPTHGVFTLKADIGFSGESVNLQIIDVAGKIILNQTAAVKHQSLEKTIDISKAPAGQYFIRIVSSATAVVLAFAKQ
jgi:hypothetical protein